MELFEGATLANGEADRIKQGLKELAKDPHAPRSINVSVNLHIHNEFPKTLYLGKGSTKPAVVLNQAEEEKARAAGYNDFVVEDVAPAPAAPAPAAPATAGGPALVKPAADASAGQIGQAGATSDSNPE